MPGLLVLSVCRCFFGSALIWTRALEHFCAGSHDCHAEKEDDNYSADDVAKVLGLAAFVTAGGRNGVLVAVGQDNLRGNGVRCGGK